MTNYSFKQRMLTIGLGFLGLGIFLFLCTEAPRLMRILVPFTILVSLIIASIFIVWSLRNMIPGLFGNQPKQEKKDEE